jgi:hypothetical protein
MFPTCEPNISKRRCVPAGISEAPGFSPEMQTTTIPGMQKSSEMNI